MMGVRGTILQNNSFFLFLQKEIQAQFQFLKQEREKLKEEKIAKDQRSQEFLVGAEAGCDVKHIRCVHSVVKVAIVCIV